MKTTELFKIIFHTNTMDTKWLNDYLDRADVTTVIKQCLPDDVISVSRFEWLLSDFLLNVKQKHKKNLIDITPETIFPLEYLNLTKAKYIGRWRRFSEPPTKKEIRLQLSVFLSAVIASHLKIYGKKGMADLIKVYMYSFELLQIEYDEVLLKRLCPADGMKETREWKNALLVPGKQDRMNSFDILTITIYLTLWRMKYIAVDDKDLLPVSGSWGTWLYNNTSLSPDCDKEKQNVDEIIKEIQNNRNEAYGLVLQYDAGPQSDAVGNKGLSDIRTTYPQSQSFFEGEINQNLYCGQKIITTSMVPELESLIKLNRIVVEGHGGMGKTTFLQHVYHKATASSLFSFVCLLSLPTLVPFDNIQNVKKQLSQFEYIKSGMIHLSDLNFEAFYHAAVNPEQKPVMLLLDGFNELLTCQDTLAIQRIREEIGSINKTWKNAVVMIASKPISQPVEVALAYDELDGFATCYLSGVPKEKYNNLLDAHPDMPEELRAIVDIPMYYTLLTTLDFKSSFPRNRYSLFLQIHNSLFDQIVGRSKDIRNLSLYYFAFYIVVPHIARLMCHNNNAYRLDHTVILGLIQDFIKNKNTYVQAVLYDTAGVELSQDVPYNAAHILNLLLGNEILQKTNHNQYKFSHDDWAEFYAAYSYVVDANLIKNCYANEEFSRHVCIDLNLSSSAVQLIREGLMFEDKDKNFINVFGDFFQNLTYNRRADCLCGEIKYANLLFQFADYLQIEKVCDKKDIVDLRKIMLEILERTLPFYKQEFQSSSDLPQTVAAHELIVVICKICELYRRNHDFALEYQYLEWADSLLCAKNETSQHAFSQRMIAHQKAKAYLQNFQSIILTEPIISNIPDIQGVKGYWDKGIAFLSENARTGHNLSSNLLGFIQSNPAPFLIEQKLMPPPDPVAGFNTYLASIKASRFSFSHWERGDLVYTVRNAVALLLKGYVEIADDGKVTEGDAQPDRISENALTMAHALLNDIAGQQYTFLEFLRGYLLLRQGNKSQAYSHFLSEAGLMSSIILNYVYGLHIELEPFYTEMKDSLTLNHIDETAAIYFYIDAKKLELAYAPESIRNERKKFFQNYESEMTKTCKSLLKLYKV